MRPVRIRSYLSSASVKRPKIELHQTAPDLLALLIDEDFYSSRRQQMKNIVKSIGDRELAWIMMAIAGVLLWSTWGLA